MSESFLRSETEALVERMLADQLGPEEWDQLLRLAEEDPVCRQYVDLHHGLVDVEHDPSLPSDLEFDQMRARVLQAAGPIAESRRPVEAPVLRPSWGQVWKNPSFITPIAATVIAALALGWWLGQRETGALMPVTDQMLLSELSQEIDTGTLRETVESGPRLSSVRFRDSEDDRVSVSFDLVRRVQFEGGRDEPIVREAMLQSLMNDRSLGGRLEALDQAERVTSNKVTEGLTFAMLHDAELPVRLRAQSILLDQAPTEELVSAFLSVVSGEESVQMRLKAMDYLAAHDVDSQRMQTLLERIDPTEASPLWVRAVDRGLIQREQP